MFVHTQWLYLRVYSVLKYAQADQDKYMKELIKNQNQLDKFP